MTFPNDPTSQPQDGSTAQQPVTPEGDQTPQQYVPSSQPASEPIAYDQSYQPPAYQPGYQPPAYQPGYQPPSYPPGYPQPYGVAVPPESQGGNGLGIAAIVLAVLISPVGLILGIIAALKPRTRTLGIIAIVVSLVVGVLAIVLTIVLMRTVDGALNGAGKTAAATAPAGNTGATPPAASGADPACGPTEQVLISSSQDLKAHQSDPAAVARTLNDIVDKLTAQKALATDPAVVAGLDAVIKDYSELSDDLKNNKAPDKGFLTKLTTDATNLTIACS